MPAFWLIWLMFACSAVAGQMIIGHLAIIAQVQAGIAWGFLFVVFLAVFNTAGRLCGGFLSDRLGREKVLLLAFAVQALNMLFFNFYTTPFLLTAGIVIAGLAYGSLFALFPPLTYDVFGLKNGGANYGLVFTACGAAGMAGPYLAGRIVDASGSYGAAYLAASALLVVSIVMCALLPKILLRGTPAKELLPPLS